MSRKEDELERFVCGRGRRTRLQRPPIGKFYFGLHVLQYHVCCSGRLSLPPFKKSIEGKGGVSGYCWSVCLGQERERKGEAERVGGGRGRCGCWSVSTKDKKKNTCPGHSQHNHKQL